ncbi:precorrin-6y C5,15-methyltransferase subunit CbiE [Asanoa ishikariensis]|uniref:Precorrin-6Y C5,15-methyltransferase (Decarboxylating) n=1 Tax=Asanoa ishikariensis TaxID=137265 RepID=A0A1H3RZY2_9ACTN|nr:precorrin-6y C5,15-methyltransferase (decarboxylating) subunit CbiE [Asanoa ishikariensis]GIF66651.1 precorrin-6y C5,15-methyltransferase subunit CbiE [Asanoa ishikariensis]SDZ31127.1 precorrin-6Y C5,15-methyltransferase (decarboxylating) [Asanoa ishikariensis]
MPEVTVYGYDGGPLPAAVAEATLLVGGARHLDGVSSDAERVVMGSLSAAVERISIHDGSVAVVASGDPGFFGIVRALRRAGLDPVVRPAVSSVASAFARLGLPWDDAVVVSAHGRDGGLRRAINVCRAYPKVAVLTGPGAEPPALAAGLQGWQRRVVVASQLGTASERLTGPEGDWTEPNVAIVLARDVADGPAGWLAGGVRPPDGWALPEDAFRHRASMITKAEVRAVALAHLRPAPGMLVWDVGAGSGSVAVECGRFGAAVVAVDRDPASADLVRANAAQHGVDVRVVTGAAPAVLADLPDPDAVFVGGGGPDVLAAVLGRGPAQVVAAYAAVEPVGPAADALTAAGYTTGGAQLQTNRLVEIAGRHRLAATNPVTLVWGAR